MRRCYSFAMPTQTPISQRLVALATNAESDDAQALVKAAKKLESYDRAPGGRKNADRIAPVLTPAVVRALGEAFVDLRTEEVTDGTDIRGSEYVQADYAFAALLIASQDPVLAAAAEPAVQAVIALLPSMEARSAEHIHHLSGEYAKVEAAGRLRAAAMERLEQEPETLASVWARDLGLDLPKSYWSLTIGLANLDVENGDGQPTRIDATIWADVKSYPGVKSDWNIRIGTIGRDQLGESDRRTRGDYERTSRSGGLVLEGHVDPAESPFDFPRVVQEIQAAHPELVFDFAKLSLSGGPGRLGTPTRKKRIAAWLKGEWTPEG